MYPVPTIENSHRLLLLRHGEVESHDGDVPISDPGAETAREVGRSLVGQVTGPVRILCGDTRRAEETAEAIAAGLLSRGGQVDGPRVAFALRNPDLYILGTRVSMVSSARAFAAQVEGLDPDDVAHLDFYPEFIRSSDRVGWWLRHETPPGEGASSVADRIRHFAGSLVDLPSDSPSFTVAVTHSPILRAVALRAFGHDIGEPAWVSGLDLLISPDRSFTIRLFP